MTIKKIISLVTAAILCISILTGCASSYEGIDYSDVTINMDTSPDAIENLTYFFYVGSDMSTQNPININSGVEIQCTINLYDGLISADVDGNIIPAVAESWESSDDGKTWTFHLRDDCYWVNYKGEIQRAVTSEDFVTGLEWALNYAENHGETLRIAYMLVSGADEYYEYTQNNYGDDFEFADYDLFTSMVGIETPDDITVVYHTSEPCPFFISAVSSPEFLPLARDHLSDVGVDGFYTNSYYDAWFNGPYLMTEFIVDNEKILDANPYWYGNEDHTRFKSVTFKAVEDKSVAYQLYKNHELDYVELSQSQLSKIVSDENHEFYSSIQEGPVDKYSYSMFFNFNKKLDNGEDDENWNRAVANEAFRKALYYGLDTTQLLKFINMVNPYKCETNTLSTRNLVKFSDGTDYIDRVESKLDISDYTGTGLRKLNQEKFEKYKAQAIKELTAQGVEFPIVLTEYCLASSKQDIDYEMIYKRMFEESLGTDFIKYDIKTYVSSYYTEVFLPCKYSIVYSTWGADYADPQSILYQYTYNEDAYEQEYMQLFSIPEEDVYGGDKEYLKDTVDKFKIYTEMFNRADAIADDNDARFEAFAEAEAYYIEHALGSIPVYIYKEWMLTRIDYDTVPALSFGNYKTRFVDMKTNRNGYTNDLKKEEKG